MFTIKIAEKLQVDQNEVMAFYCHIFNYCIDNYNERISIAVIHIIILIGRYMIDR